MVLLAQLNPVYSQFENILSPANKYSKLPREVRQPDARVGLAAPLVRSLPSLLPPPQAGEPCGRSLRLRLSSAAKRQRGLFLLILCCYGL